MTTRYLMLEQIDWAIKYYEYVFKAVAQRTEDPSLKFLISMIFEVKDIYMLRNYIKYLDEKILEASELGYSDIVQKLKERRLKAQTELITKIKERIRMLYKIIKNENMLFKER